MEISKDLSARRAEIASVVVVLVSPTVLFIASLNEAQLNAVGKASSVTDQAGVSALLDVLARGRIAETAGGENAAIDARIGIYLRWHDGHGSRLVFDGAGRCGLYDGAICVHAASPRFAHELRAWAAGREPAPAAIEIAL